MRWAIQNRNQRTGSGFLHFLHNKLPVHKLIARPQPQQKLKSTKGV